MHLLALSASLLMIPATALAQELSTDVAFVRPSFGTAAFSGVDVARGEDEVTVRTGLLAQYLRAPVVLYDPRNRNVGALVKNRAAFALGVSVDVSPGVTLALALPAAMDWGTDLQPSTLDGFGAGDVAAGVRVNAIDTGTRGALRLNAGIRGALLVPTGRRGAFLGEESVRASFGLLASADLGPLRVGTDAGVMARQLVRSEVDFQHGSEVTWGNGVRLALPDATRTALTTQLLSRFGLRNFLGGGAETAVEGLAGVELLPLQALKLELSGGRGFSQGAGTTDYRVLSLITVEIPRPRAQDPTVAQPETLPPPPPPPTPVLPDAPEPEPEWREGQLAKVTDDREQIVIRDMLEFRVGTTELLDRSRPTLVAVARLINDEATIGHVVIEGHASEEGGYSQNYALSMGRAQTIFEELLRQGVHPDRISIRGMGEVEPLVGPVDGASAEANEARLQRNRRVEFHIVHTIDDLFELPRYRTRGNLLPWSGEPYEVEQPPQPAVERPRPEPAEPSEPAFDQVEDEEFELEK